MTGYFLLVFITATTASVQPASDWSSCFEQKQMVERAGRKAHCVSETDGLMRGSVLYLNNVPATPQVNRITIQGKNTIRIEGKK